VGSAPSTDVLAIRDAATPGRHLPGGRTTSSGSAASISPAA
jgi:hypothetical protein